MFPSTSTIAQALFILNGTIWLVLCILSLVRLTNISPNLGIIGWMIAILMYGNAAVLFLSAALIGKQKRLYFYFAIFVLLINIFLTITDQVGLLDWITLAVDLILLGILIVHRRTFTANPANSLS